MASSNKRKASSAGLSDREARSRKPPASNTASRSKSTTLSSTDPSYSIDDYFNDLWNNLHSSFSSSELSPFEQLPSKDDYPEYYTTIESPICLSQIKQKFDNHEYSSIDDIINDFSLLCNNALTFNDRFSDLYNLAQSIHAHIHIFAIVQKVPIEYKEYARQILQEEVRILNEVERYRQRVKNASKTYIADSFLELPSKAEYPSYYKVIKTPVSIDSVRQLIWDGKMLDFDYFYTMTNLIFTNAQTFNDEKSAIYQDSLTLQKTFNFRFERAQNRFIQKLNDAKSEFATLDHQLYIKWVSKFNYKTAKIIPLKQTKDVPVEENTPSRPTRSSSNGVLKIKLKTGSGSPPSSPAIPKIRLKNSSSLSTTTESLEENKRPTTPHKIKLNLKPPTTPTTKSNASNTGSTLKKSLEEKKKEEEEKDLPSSGNKRFPTKIRLSLDSKNSKNKSTPTKQSTTTTTTTTTETTEEINISEKNEKEKEEQSVKTNERSTRVKSRKSQTPINGNNKTDATNIIDRKKDKTESIKEAIDSKTPAEDKDKTKLDDSKIEEEKEKETTLNGSATKEETGESVNAPKAVVEVPEIELKETEPEKKEDVQLVNREEEELARKQAELKAEQEKLSLMRNPYRRDSTESISDALFQYISVSSFIPTLSKYHLAKHPVPPPQRLSFFQLHFPVSDNFKERTFAFWVPYYHKVLTIKTLLHPSLNKRHYVQTLSRDMGSTSINPYFSSATSLLSDPKAPITSRFEVELKPGLNMIDLTVVASPLVELSDEEDEEEEEDSTKKKEEKSNDENKTEKEEEEKSNDDTKKVAEPNNKPEPRKPITRAEAMSAAASLSSTPTPISKQSNNDNNNNNSSESVTPSSKTPIAATPTTTTTAAITTPSKSTPVNGLSRSSSVVAKELKSRHFEMGDNVVTERLTLWITLGSSP